MLLPLDIHPHAAEDLRQIQEDDRVSYARLLALLRELKHDYKLQERMLNQKESEQSSIGRVHFQKWEKQFQRDNELWRVKVYEFDRDVQALPYRIIYAHHPWNQNDPSSYFQILAIVHRDDFNYETNSDISKRVESDYKELRSI